MRAKEINHRQRIGKSFRRRDRSVSRAMKHRRRSKVRRIAFFENMKFHREKRQIRQPILEAFFGYFFAKISQFLTVITFSWADFGDVFFGNFFAEKSPGSYDDYNKYCGAFFSIFGKNSSICYSYDEKKLGEVGSARVGSGQVTP